MATTRLRLREPGEPVPDPSVMHILEPFKVDWHKHKFASDKIIAENDLRRKFGQLLYLRNLAKAQDIMADGVNPEPCPVCQLELGKRWHVLLCGHSFCLDCVQILVGRRVRLPGGRGVTFPCPVCRQRSREVDVACVSTQHEESGPKVKGDHSTKVQGVVKCLREIHEKEPNAKALVFSTWTLVLEVISRALDDNNIPYLSLHSHKFQANLTSFKHDPDVHVLLLPVHSGANGLNLIEASHVLLVEPILNPAQELQAVGRIHRIGQTKPTFIHRFLVKGTIEERMHSLLESSRRKHQHEPINSHSTEQAPFSLGDFTQLFTQPEIEVETAEINDEPEENTNL